MFLLWEENAYCNAFKQVVLMINDIFDPVTRPTNSWIINETQYCARYPSAKKFCVCVQAINIESLTQKREGEI